MPRYDLVKRDPKTGRFLPRKRKPPNPKKRRKPSGEPAPKRGRPKRTGRQRKRVAYTKRNPPMPAPQRDVLEIMVDTYTLQGVLDGLGEICFEKAEHLVTNWMDKSSAVPWRQMGNRMYQEASKAKDRGV